jgi:hypothetical protein
MKLIIGRERIDANWHVIIKQQPFKRVYIQCYHSYFHESVFCDILESSGIPDGPLCPICFSFSNIVRRCAK